MAILGRRRDDSDDEQDGNSLALDLDDRVCPTCGRELPPWVSTCPADGAAPVDRARTAGAALPDIPAHLLDGLDDPPADQPASAGEQPGDGHHGAGDDGAA